MSFLNKKKRILITGSSGLLGYFWINKMYKEFEIILVVHKRQLNYKNLRSIQIDLFSLKMLKSLNNYLPRSIKLNISNENSNLNDLIMYIEPLRNFLEILQKVPGYSMDIFLKRVPRLINEPYTKEMGIKIAKKVTEKGVVRLVKIAAGANI